MSPSPQIGAFARLMAGLRRCLSKIRHIARARHIEQFAYVAPLRAQAYVVRRLAAFRKIPAEAIEARALLASQEAKAYADDAVHSLSMALRSMAKILAGTNRRIETLEAAQSEIRDDIRELVVGVEAALREIDAQLDALMRQTATPVQRKTHRPDSTISADAMSAPPKE